MSELLHLFVDYIVGIVGDLGYLGIFLLMTLESSFVPFPSEVVLVPAGYLVKQGEMNGILALLAGGLGSLTGALINYFLAFKLGRAAVLKYGRYILISPEKLTKVENHVRHHGNFITFVGRLIFGVRQLISIPAGLARMPLLPFVIYTTLGASIWSAILLSLGYVLGTGEDALATAKLVGYWVFAVVIILSIAYYFWCSPKKKTIKIAG